MEGAACSTAPQLVVGVEEQGEVGLAGDGGHPGSLLFIHFVLIILKFDIGYYITGEQVTFSQYQYGKD